MAGMRDKVIHDYLGVNLHIVWETVEKRVPDLAGKIGVILSHPDTGADVRPDPSR